MIYVFLVLILLALILLVVLVVLLLDDKKGHSNQKFQHSGDNYYTNYPNGRTDINGINVVSLRPDDNPFFGITGIDGGSFVIGRGMRLTAQIYLEDCNTKSVYRGLLGDDVVLGRLIPEQSNLNNIPVSPSVNVSRRHCRFFECNGYIFLENLSHTGVTYLNDNPIDGVVPVKVGDIVGIVDVNLRIISIQIY